MWWMPLIQLGMNKMAEKKALEDARQQQTHKIRSSTAQSFGAPGYGPDTARSMYDTERQIDAAKRQSNSQMLGNVFQSMGSSGSAGPDSAPSDDSIKAAKEAARQREFAQQYLQRNRR
jgi:hypothetical protein